MIEIDKRFSETVKYGYRNEQWSNIIFLKAQELANHLVGKKGFDLSKPDLRLERVDSKELREKIMKMTFREWRDLG